ncbi:hypothetical protein R50073_13600 [Maricurvus nonylphenolicus]|uniref:Crp/Fnr family transcriptional regulator n=1 Tax=Maricurvus nonylphenolicus TaxID=1008307 RepID=UPI0036F19E7A
MAGLRSHFQTGWIDRLPEKVRQEVRDNMSRIDLAKGQSLYLEGDVVAGIYEIRAGKIKLSSIGYSGKEMTLTICLPPVTLGDVSLVTGTPSIFSAYATQDTELGLLDRECFERLRNKHPQINEILLKSVCYRQTWMLKVLQDSAILSIESRLAKRLQTLAYSIGTPIGSDAQSAKSIKVPIKQDELSTMLGVSRQTINQLLNDWESLGFVALVYGAVVINDSQLLTDLIEHSDS